MAKMADTFPPDKFKILAFPCNQFGAQEPGSHEEIIKFVHDKFNGADAKFDFFEKSNVNDPNPREVFAFLKSKLPDEDGSIDIPWNFSKFLVTHEGIPFKRYGTRIRPMDFKADIEELLSKL
mmetsp:Transcript_8755/g.13545  ORF Transcript_8755/g.13545 Transcript_8755/m.13545 type:complete len:122 (+) Transcript_8755:304-669(+)|eukprot:CAMPEP_0118682484 /NCGR_PEP_ID=MMETSP0800-20121206/5508_1 /TAXON_ID=210618 ORGANISM="Striatella unipunctata, Strain CCMP2910" /NCGR_SAMPLE_ID=MMETSP0800 /ASSEMBLY_ACC=CAM_ASM_000638 /LENGTH=121 /DNA_ID=CAMNT_0006578873 /DNA_START=239 /DNA_END=604 /DNA_ORIENTATION=+